MKNRSIRNFYNIVYLFFLIIINIFPSLYSLANSGDIQKNLIEKTEKSNKDDILQTKDLQNDIYILGRGDHLSLEIVGLPELNRRIKILNDGNASIPIIGTRRLEGLTLDAATKFIEDGLSDELINANVELTLIEARPIKVSVVGEVSRPGIYTLTSGSSNDLPNISTAIEAAGGLSRQANLNSVILKRKLSTKNLEYKQTTLNLRSLILEGQQLQNPNLFDGDVIKVSRLTKMDQDILTLSSSTLAPENITVNFIGEINKPGSIKISPNSTLIDGIMAAGGPKSLRSNYNFIDSQH